MYSSPIFFIVPLLIGLWFYCIADIIRGKFVSDKDKFTSLLLVVFVPFIGIPIYLIVWRSKKLGKVDKSLF
jgi:hypothetical protein